MSLSKNRLEAMLRNRTPKVSNEFNNSFKQMAQNANYGDVLRFVENNDVDGIMRAISFVPGVFAGPFFSLSEFFKDAGDDYTMAFPTLRDQARGITIKPNFDPFSARARAYVLRHHDDIMSLLTSEQVTALQFIISNGYARGRTMEQIALDIVGRADRTTRVRAATMIGLTEPQARWVANATDQLMANNERSLLAQTQRTLATPGERKAIQEAVRKGRGLTPSMIQRTIAGYTSRMLKHRADNIARTEVARTRNTAMQAAIEQQMDDGTLPPGMMKRWITIGDDVARHTHAAMQSHPAIPLADDFSVGGSAAKQPLDLRLPAKETVNCRCYLQYEEPDGRVV